MSDKIKPRHLARKVVLYVRQSSPHQVMHNQESRRLQYAMKDRLRHLGWNDLYQISLRPTHHSILRDGPSGLLRMR